MFEGTVRVGARDADAIYATKPVMIERTTLNHDRSKMSMGGSRFDTVTRLLSDRRLNLGS
jgi:hypothetical protein